MSDAAPVQFTVVRTKADYLNAMLLHALRSPWTLRQIFMAPAVVALVPFFVLADEPLDARLIMSGVMFSLALVAMLVALAPCYYWAARNSWRSPGALQPIEYAFDAAGMRVRSAAGSGEIGWISFNGAFEDSKLFLLRQHPGLLQIVPKRDVEAGAMTRLRQLVRDHVKGPLRIKARSAS